MPISPIRSLRFAPAIALGAGLCLLTSASLAIPVPEDSGGRHDQGPSSPSGPAGGEVYPALDVVLKSRISLQTFDMGDGADCWGYTSPSGREYAIMTFTGGLSFIEVTNPSSPVILQNFPTSGTSLWSDAKVIGDKCYFIKDRFDTGLQVYDLAQIDDGVVTKIIEFRGSGIEWAHNVVAHAESDTIYLAGANAPTDGLVAIDVSNPAAPVVTGQYSGAAYIHDAQVVTWPHPGPWQNKTIAFCFAATQGVDIVDVTNPSAMTRLARITYPGLAYSHQGWVDVDRQILFQNDELDEVDGNVSVTTTRVFDVSNLASPTSMGSFSTGLTTIDHNLYTRDGFVYQANYQSGMRIFDIRTDPTNPTEVGWIDTFPASDEFTFDGAWNVFPYFPSGTVLISDINRGLFVVDPTLALSGGSPAAFDFVSDRPTDVAQRGQEITVSIASQNGRVIDPATAKMTYHLHPRPGSGYTNEFRSIPLEPLGGDEYLARFPFLPCGEMIHYFFEVASTDGLEVRWPLSAPLQKYPAEVADRTINGFTDDLESDLGWTVGSDSDTATTGVWERVIPVGTSSAPGEDASEPGSFAFVTGNGAPGGAVGANDVDGGSTTLVSPLIDASAPRTRLNVSLWFDGSLDGDDELTIEFSPDDGATWVVAARFFEPLNGWERRVLLLDQYIPRTAQTRVRFIATDGGAGSIVEAGVDDVLFTSKECDPLLAGDANNDGIVDFADLNAVLGSFGQSGFLPGIVQGDVNNDGLVDFADLNATLANFGQSN
jgi:choice-of-anchor B domain-containing protein